MIAGLQQTITFIVNQYWHPNNNDGILFGPQPQYIYFMLIEEKRNQKKVIFKKLESENFALSIIKILSIYLIVDN